MTGVQTCALPIWLPEVRDLSAKYGGIDVYRDPIPVQPSVHFFMGGLAVHPCMVHFQAFSLKARMQLAADRLNGSIGKADDHGSKGCFQLYFEADDHHHVTWWYNGGKLGVDFTAHEFEFDIMHRPP